VIRIQDYSGQTNTVEILTALNSGTLQAGNQYTHISKWPKHTHSHTTFVNLSIRSEIIKAAPIQKSEVVSRVEISTESGRQNVELLQISHVTENNGKKKILFLALIDHSFPCAFYNYFSPVMLTYVYTHTLSVTKFCVCFVPMPSTSTCLDSRTVHTVPRSYRRYTTFTYLLV